jgi:Protein of unknown function (DUF2934)
MQSSETKTKRSRQSVQEPTPVQAAAQTIGSEEATKLTRKSAASKKSGEATPAAKQHRGAAKKTVEPKSESTLSDPVGVVLEETRVAPGKVSISHAEIARLAYSYWEARGSRPGSPEEDWLRAERELTSH